jgi:glycosyltransferase involved in cell wall biosynthesis
MDKKIGENPLVSVIIPSYNSAKYVVDAVDSALEQVYRPIEVIVVNDGSTDDTDRILEPYVKTNQIRYFYQPNGGLASARNAGLKMAEGKYVALLDSDDLFLPKKIERQIEHLEDHPECGVCYCDLWHFFDGKPEENLKLNYEYYSGPDVFKNLLHKNFINPLSVVMRRSILEEAGYFNEKFRRSEDWEYWIRLAYRGVRFCFLPEILARYRMRKESLSYSWSDEIERKRTELEIFRGLNGIMSAEERRRYGMKLVMLKHWLKLMYAKVGRRLKILKFIHSWFQKKRLKSA